MSKLFSRFIQSQKQKPAVAFADQCLLCEDPCNVHRQASNEIQAMVDSSSDFADSIKPYRRHVLALMKSGEHASAASSWPPVLEDVNGSFFKEMKLEMKKESGRSAMRVMFTAFSEMTTNNDVINDDCTQVLVMPDMLRLKLKQDEIQNFAKWINSDTSSVPEYFNWTKSKFKYHIFVCCHLQRDKRCGEIGPLLVNEFKSKIKEIGRFDSVGVWGVSHVGGHKYAGKNPNLIAIRKCYHIP